MKKNHKKKSKIQRRNLFMFIFFLCTLGLVIQLKYFYRNNNYISLETDLAEEPSSPILFSSKMNLDERNSLKNHREYASLSEPVYSALNSQVENKSEDHQQKKLVDNMNDEFDQCIATDKNQESMEQNKVKKVKFADDKVEEEFIRFKFGFGNSRIDANDKITNGHAIFLSDVNLELQTDILFSINEYFRFFGSLKYNSESYSQLKQGVIGNTKLDLFAYGFGSEYSYYQTSQIYLLLSQSQKKNIRAISADQYAFFKAWTQEISVGTSFIFLKNEHVSTGLELEVNKTFPTSTDLFQIDSGIAYTAKINFMKNQNGIPLKMTLEYVIDNVNSIIVTQKNQEAKMSIGVVF